MSIFYDDTGRDWEIQITPKTMYRLKQLTQGHRDTEGNIVFADPVDLANAASNNSLAVIADIYPRSIVVFLLCEKQAKERGITEGEFLDAMLSEKAISEMTDSLLQAIEESFPNAQVRTLAHKIRLGEKTLAKVVTSVHEKILPKSDAEIALSDQEIEEAVTEAIAKAMPGISSGDALQLPETPGE